MNIITLITPFLLGVGSSLTVWVIIWFMFSRDIFIKYLQFKYEGEKMWSIYFWGCLISSISTVIYIVNFIIVEL